MVEICESNPLNIRWGNYYRIILNINHNIFFYHKHSSLNVRQREFFERLNSCAIILFDKTKILIKEKISLPTDIVVNSEISRAAGCRISVQHNRV